MKKVDFNFTITDGTGEVIDPKSAAEILAFYLNQAILKDEAKIAKFHGWASQLSRKEILELDDGDIITLKDFILNHDQIFAVTKHPMLLVFSQPPSPGTKPRK